MVTRGHRQINVFARSCDFLFTVPENYVSTLYGFQDTANHLSKVVHVSSPTFIGTRS